MYRRFKRTIFERKINNENSLQEEFNMNKTELVAAMADQAGLSKKDAEKALKAFTDVVAEELKKDGKVQLVGFGTFEVSSRAAREGRNPQSGKPMKMQPLNAYHRRLVHNALQSVDGVTTESEEGDGRYKRITIRRV